MGLYIGLVWFVTGGIWRVSFSDYT